MIKYRKHYLFSNPPPAHSHTHNSIYTNTRQNRCTNNLWVAVQSIPLPLPGRWIRIDSISSLSGRTVSNPHLTSTKYLCIFTRMNEHATLILKLIINFTFSCKEKYIANWIHVIFVLYFINYVIIGLYLQMSLKVI